MIDGPADPKENAATTMDREEKYFELLLSEKQHADSAIGGYADLHVKLFGFFGVGITLLGWLYKDDGKTSHAGFVAIAFAVISCGIMVHGMSTYSLTLGYIQWKNKTLNPAFQKLLGLPQPPLTAVPAWGHSEARGLTTVSSVFLFILHKFVASSLLILGAYSLLPTKWNVALLVGAWCIMLLCVAVETISYRAIRRVLLEKV
jgi:hypothetical protein